MASQDWLEKDFYAVLGVSKDVSDAELKKQYRTLARKYHPDANPGDAKAEERFKEISEAYTVLSDPEQRKEYDALRAMGSGARFSAGAGPSGASGSQFEDLFGGLFGGGPGGGTRVRFQTSGAPGAGFGGAANYDDLLNGMFGGAGQAGAGFSAGRPGRDVEARAKLTFDQAIQGATVALGTPSGATVRTKIPAGVKDGQRIRIRGKGEPGVGGGAAGDLIVRVHVEEHPVFRREGDDLVVDLPVTFAEAANGATVEVPTYRGDPVRVRVRAGTPSGRMLRVKGRGVKTSRRTGDLLARVQILVPDHLSAKAKRALADFEAATGTGDDARAELLRDAQR